MPLLPAVGRSRKALEPAPQLNAWVPAYPVPPGQAGRPYRDGWDVQRAVEQGMSRSVPLMRGIMAIANNQAKLPIVMREGNRWSGREVEHPLTVLFNAKTSMYETALNFRKRLSMQLLLNPQGAMIEVIRSRMGQVLALYLLPAGYTWPIPDEQVFVSAFRVQMPGKCLLPGTGIVTKRGVVPVEDVQVGDQVVTHLGRWRKVTDTSVRPTEDGEMVVQLKGKGLEAITLTGDHKVWAARYGYRQSRRFEGVGWVPAKEMVARASSGHKPHHAMTVPKLDAEAHPVVRLLDYVHESKFQVSEAGGVLVSSHRNTTSVPAEVKLTHQLGRLLGLYLAEGWTSGSRGPSEMGWAFHEDETNLQAEVVEALSDIFGVDAKVSERPGRCRAVLACSRLVANLFACGDARTKRLPDWAWGGDREFMEGLLSGWVDGDGHVRQRGEQSEVSVSTASESLAWHMRLIAIACGREAYQASRERKSPFGGAMSTEHVVSWTEGRRRPGMYRLDDQSLTAPVEQVEPVDYSGPVHDLTVEDDHSFLTVGGMVHNSWFDVSAENVIWIREPHPTNPYSGITPLEPAGLAVETDWFARMYQRNFLVNDGRPGGILAVKGELEDDDAEELRTRIQGRVGNGYNAAGRIAVIEADDITYEDLAAVPRDAQYTESRESDKEEILGALGVPESIAYANSSEKTFNNADADIDVFWRETMLNHLGLIAAGLDELDPNPQMFLGYDLRQVKVLQKDEQERKEFALSEVNANVISADEYRDATGRDPVGASRLYQPVQLLPVANTAAPSVLPYDHNPNMWDPATDEATRSSGGIQLKAFEPNGNGVMVNLDIPADVAAQLAVEGGEPTAAMHITLAYLGRAGSLSDAQVAMLRGAVAAFAAGISPFRVTLSGTGRFTASANSDGKEVVYASVDAPGLAEVRSRLVVALGAAGITVANEHGFTPHVTVAYVDAGEPSPAVTCGQTFLVTDLQVTVGKELDSYPLRAGVVDVKSAISQMENPENDAEEEQERLGVPAGAISRNVLVGKVRAPKMGRPRRVPASRSSSTGAR